MTRGYRADSIIFIFFFSSSHLSLTSGSTLEVDK